MNHNEYLGLVSTHLPVQARGMAAATATAAATPSFDDQQSPEYEELPAPWSIPPIVSFDPGSVKGPKQFLSVVHAEEKVPFSSNSRKCFLQEHAVSVKIVNHERRRRLGRATFNAYLYTVEVDHGDYNWTVFRTYTHFVKLHAALWKSHPLRTLTLWNQQHHGSGDEVSNEGGEVIIGRADVKSKQQHQETVEAFEITQHGEDVHQPVSDSRDQTTSRIPIKFPKRPEMMLGADEIKRRIAQLETYLNAALQYEEYRNHSAMLEFLEVSEFSFVKDLIKAKEGMVRKRVGDAETNKIHHRFFSYLKLCFRGFTRSRWRRIWLIIQETCIVGINPRSGQVNLVLLFDTEFKYSSGKRQTDVSKDCMKITNLSRVFYMETINNSKIQNWTTALEKLLTGGPGRDFVPIHGSPNPNKSFAPVRENQVGYWFVDGQSYFSAVYDVIDMAQEEVYITDWWLSPEVYLKRGHEVEPGSQADYRLDKLLKKKAAQGVKIFVLLYKELTLALALDSMYTKKVLQSRNIRVLRHPDRVGNEDFQFKEFLWAHHEKLVVVDQSYAFVGGIDLCYGRWDNPSHHLTDLPPSSMTSSPSCASSVAASVAGIIPHSDSVDSVGLKLNNQKKAATSSRINRKDESAIAQALVRTVHETAVAPVFAIAASEQRDTSSKDKQGLKDRIKSFRFSKKRLRSSRKRSKSTKSPVSQDVATASSSDSDMSDFSDVSNDSVPTGDKLKKKLKRLTRLRSARHNSDQDQPDGGPSVSVQPQPKDVLWRGKDYVNFIVKDVTRPDLPDGDNVDRTETPRMPWHDVSTMVQGEAARDVARHFIQRWNAVKTEKARFNTGFPYLIPKAYGSFQPPATVLKNCHRSPRVTCQVLRSASDWSAGIEDHESSIYSAVETAIEASEFYVYIENQFFITSCADGLGAGHDHDVVENTVGKALYERILRAYREGKSYRVYVLVPLLPAFEGDVGGAGSAMHCVLHYQNSSIATLFKKLKEAGVPDPTQFLSFSSLRTWSELCDTPVTELIYIHSKLLIADDKVLICGSANINDRSLLGYRDSEVCLRFEDVEFREEVKLEDGRVMRSGSFAGKMRRYLMREHLGMSLPGAGGRGRKSPSFGTVADCVSDSFYNKWNQVAEKNTKVFEDNFFCIPSDTLASIEACASHQKRTPFAEINRVIAKKNMESVQGNLVQLPWKFLKDSNLLPNYGVKEGLVPPITWT